MNFPKNPLKVSLTPYLPDSEAHGVIILAPAMGVNQRYYAALANWLTTKGFIAVTFDFQGMGVNSPKQLKHIDINITDWIETDCARVIARCRESWPDLKITWVGHSLSGQIFPLIPNQTELSGIVSIASGSGFWRLAPMTMRFKALTLWHLLVPVLTPLFGYFPGKKLGVVANLPKRVIYQWRKWCLDSDYCLAAAPPSMRATFTSTKQKVVALTFDDDHMISFESARALHRLFARNDIGHQHISSSQTPFKRIGHFGFFRHRQQEALWATYLLPAIISVVDQEE